MMHINEEGLNIIKESEGLRLRAYKCPAGVWTIGFGRTKSVVKGQKITKQQAEKFLLEDVAWAELCVNSLAPNVPLSENEFSALVSLVFNIGVTNFQKSTLLKLLNKKQYDKAANEFLKWNKANVRGKMKALSGLTLRREKERVLFLKA